MRAQLLDAERPTGLLELVRHLGMLQLDPIAAVAPSADLVAWSRLGSSYFPAELRERPRGPDAPRAEGDRPARGGHRALPCRHGGLARAWRAARLAGGSTRLGRGQRRLPAGHPCDAEGFGPAADARAAGHLRRSPGGRPGGPTTATSRRLLDFMVQRGEVAVAGRQGRERLWDLASRVYPDDPVVPAEEAQRIRDERRLRALGIARARGPKSPVEPCDVGEAGEPAVVEGVKGEWRVDPSLLGRPFSGRTALLSPFDRLVHDRKRAARAVRLRLPARDVQARGRSAAGATTRCRCCTATG